MSWDSLKRECSDNQYNVGKVGGELFYRYLYSTDFRKKLYININKYDDMSKNNAIVIMFPNINEKFDSW